jgi:hypothetical protein
MMIQTVTKSGTKVTLTGLPCDDVMITIPQGNFVGYWGTLGGVSGVVCRGKINGKDTQICAQIPRADWDTFVEGIKAELLQHVPGLTELRSAIDAEIGYAKEFDAMMEDEHNDGVFPPSSPVIKASEVAARYPIAASYMEAERWEDSSHYVKSSAGKKAKKIIAQGGDYRAAMTAMRYEWEEYCKDTID